VTQLEGNASLKGQNRRFLGGQSYVRTEGSRATAAAAGLVSNPDALLPLDMTAQSIASSTGPGSAAASLHTPSLPGGDYVSLRAGASETLPSFVGLPGGGGGGGDSHSLMDVAVLPALKRQDTFGGNIDLGGGGGGGGGGTLFCCAQYCVLCVQLMHVSQCMSASQQCFVANVYVYVYVYVFSFCLDEFYDNWKKNVKVNSFDVSFEEAATVCMMKMHGICGIYMA
jgi:hypothetical protein